MLNVINIVLLSVCLVEGLCPTEDTSLAPLPFKRPTNLTTCTPPYYDVNCICPATVFECACHKIGSCKPNVQGCINMINLYDGWNNCGDWSDEVASVCPPQLFQCHCYNTTCKDGGSCVLSLLKCDLVDDCPDGSDELSCTCPVDKFECPCYKTGNCTKLRSEGVVATVGGFNPSYGCINKSEVCDGYNNCGDWYDEINCTCPANTLECSCYNTQNCSHQFGCLNYPNIFHCDGFDSCGDWSDEINCTSCPAHMFECRCYKHRNCSSSIGCLLAMNLCDGFNHCGDWSDEENCSCPVNTFECDCYKSKNCSNAMGGCISFINQCDGLNGCGDRSDEVNCTCPANTFQCACVSTRQCVGINLNCIDHSLLCDGNEDCIDGSDETHHTCICSGISAKCQNEYTGANLSLPGRCIPYEWVGDNITDCIDGSDEVCSANYYSCQSCHSLSVSCKTDKEARKLINTNTSIICNHVTRKTCASDINNCTSEKVVCTTTSCANAICRDVFFCGNQQLVAKTEFCDGSSDPSLSCKDKSDEIQHGFGFKCSGVTRKGVCVLPQSNVYDSVAQCSDNSDLCFVNGQFRCFQCLDRKLIISSKQVCNGVVDCFDMSDECMCADQALCREVRGSCHRNEVLCYNTSVCLGQEGVLCNTSVQCSDHMNTKYCSKEKRLKPYMCPANIRTNPNRTKISNPRYKCTKLEFFMSKYPTAPNKDVLQILPFVCIGKVQNQLGVFTELHCPNFVRCSNKGEINIASDRVCDGKIDCDDKSDEFLEKCKTIRYYCKSKGRISIARKHICDGIIDCDDETDESRCSCERTRFFCSNSQPISIDRKFVNNGIDDCSDGSDECVNLVKNAFANVNEMIANPFYRAIFWIMAILGLVGNFVVFVSTAWKLAKSNKNENVFVCTSVFILNLSAADFLMGIYLLGIIIQATRFSGSYCLFDKEWRSGSLCSGFGALAVLSSEASSFTMAAMTTFRLISSLKPFLMRNASVAKTITSGLFCWLFAILLAVIPLLQVTSGYFVTSVWFPNNFYQTDLVSRRNMSLLAHRASNSQPSHWFEVKKVISEMFPRQPIKGEFGYYGETSVCMPRLFASSGQFAWEYSTFIITINFLMFVYMVIAYAFIFKQSNRMKASRGNDKSSKMQKRISRLILTNFFCWIPICIMGYLSIAGVKMPPDAYVVSACLLLPINSAINPLLYSSVLMVRLKKARNDFTAVALSVLGTNDN